MGLYQALNGHQISRHHHHHHQEQQHAEIFQDSHDAMRSFMWHKAQKSVCALVLASVPPLPPPPKRPRHHDRFDLIGLCWLYGRSELPPPMKGKSVTYQSLTNFGCRTNANRNSNKLLVLGPLQKPHGMMGILITIVILSRL